MSDNPNAAILALLEQGQEEADAAFVALHAQWEQDDAITAQNRAWTLAAHKQGEKDRDAKRVELGGVSKIEAEKKAADEKAAAEAKAKAEAAAEAEATRKAEAKARADAAEAAHKEAEAARMSSLPVTPLMALDQKPDDEAKEPV